MAPSPRKVRAQLAILVAVEILCIILMVAGWGADNPGFFYAPLVLAISVAVICSVILKYR